MKKIAVKSVLLFLIPILLIGGSITTCCLINSTKHKGVTPDDDSPVIVDTAVDLTYEFPDDIEVLPSDKVDEIVRESFGSPLLEYVNNNYGDYYQKIKSKWYMTKDDAAVFFRFIDVTYARDLNFDDVVYFIENLNVDRIGKTAQAIFNDEASLLDLLDAFDWGSCHGLFTKANLYFNGADEEIKEGALIEQKLSGVTSDAINDWHSFFELYSTILSDHESIVLWRVLQRVLQNAIKELNHQELLYLFDSLFFVGDGELDYEIAEEYVINHHYYEFLNHVGNVILKTNVTGETIVEALKGLAHIEYIFGSHSSHWGSNQAYDYMYLLTYSHINDDILRIINPNGLKVLFDFLAKMMIEMPEGCLGYKDDEEIPVAKLYDFYKEQFVLLTQKEKDDLSSALKIIGADFDTFEEMTSDLKGEDKELFADYLNEYILVPLRDFYDYFVRGVDTELDDRSSGFSLFFKQGETITEEDLIGYIKDSDCFHFWYYSSTYYNSAAEDVEKRDNIEIISGVDTTEIGVGYFIFQADLHFTYWDWNINEYVEDVLEQQQIVWKYVVIPDDVEYFQREFYFYAIQENEVNGCYEEVNDAIDSKGNLIHDEYSIYLQKDADYAENEFYIGVCVDNDTDVFYYSSELKRFIDVAREVNKVYSSMELVDIATLDNSQLGTHYVKTYIDIYSREDDSLILKLPTVIVYNVVEELASSDFLLDDYGNFI